MELQRAPLSRVECAVKRAIDIVLSGTAFVALAPLLVVVAAAIRIESRGPVFFRQTRVGFNGRTFRIFKFRTMTTLDDDGAVVHQAAPQDERVTRFGPWLRRTSIDELPQLLNVISGEMSLVGPRPHALAHDSDFDKLLATDTHDKLERRLEFDLWYIDSWSLAPDLRILALSALCVLRGANAY